MEYSYIGIGSNQGNSIELIKRALDLIDLVPGVKITRVAPLYRTEPIGYTDQPWFYNTVAELEVQVAPFELLDILEDVERKLGRVRTIRWGPRTIDLDILLFGKNIIDEESLRIPHPLMHLRRFVLVPMVELAPDFIHPAINSKICDICKAELKKNIICKIPQSIFVK